MVSTGSTSGATGVRRLLVANRGEIARRVFATCRRLGISTVAVHSDADAGLPYVREADTAVHLPGDAPADTYLRSDLLVAAAERAGADAVHPGYGFLSENSDFARAVLAAGLTWVGPSPESIEEMGSKVRAKELMRRAGVPVLEAPVEPAEQDFPLLVKASAGGGGRGMRVVRTLAELPGAVAAASAEAASAFGDGTVFVEPYVEHGRHVEVQLLGHPTGVLVLGERDCSVQRRHQKVIEESPAPHLPDRTRAALHDAARAAAVAIDYRGAGTVEFLYDGAADRFYFLEMNTRLQVEHPVTELVAGVDLVHAQLRVAAGEPLPAGWSHLGRRGHAIEVRINAEDPAARFMPAPGPVVGWREPSGPGVRVDAGVRAGFTVPQAYDSLLAKLIVWGEDRDQARGRMLRALDEFVIEGVPTTIPFHRLAMQDPAFAAGDVSTILVEQGMDLSALAAAEPVEGGDQLGKPTPRRMVIELDGKRFDVNVFPQEEVKIPERIRTPRSPKALERARAELGGPGKEVVKTPMQGTIVKVLVANGDAVTPGQTLVVLEAMKMENHVTAHQAGKVSELNVAEGDTVPTGATIATIEAT
jgi:propionyl-CoA carboxylase alpha chain